MDVHLHHPTFPVTARFLAVLVLVLLSPLTTHGQERPKVGLALSGGGAKGFAHIGVLKVLEAEKVPLDIVTGTSMGSIVGGLYAIGYSPAQIESVALTLDWARMFQDTPERRLMAMDQKRWTERTFASFAFVDGGFTLPSGLVTGQRIGQQLAELTLPAHDVTDFAMLARPYRCVATDLSTGEPVVLSGGDLADAIRASMAIPSVFTPVTKEGRILVDGGLVRNFPVQDARALGAAVVFGVDVSDPPAPKDDLKTLPGVLNQVMNLAMAPSTEAQKKLADGVVRPDMTGVGTLDFQDVPGIIARGEAAARAAMPRLRAVLDSLGIGRYEPRGPLPLADSVRVDSVDVVGLTALGRAAMLRNLTLRIPGRVSRAQIDGAVSRIYSSGLFRTVDYRLYRKGGGSILVVRVTEIEELSLNIGLRYDSQGQGSLLGGVRFWNVGKESAYLNLEAHTGARIGITADYAIPIALIPAGGFGVQLSGLQSTVNVFSEGQQLATFRKRSLFGTVRAGTLFSSSFLLAAGIRAQHDHLKEEISLVPFEEKYWTGTLHGTVGFDTRDRVHLPRSGVSLFGVAEMGLQDWKADERFIRWWGNASGALPLGRRVVLSAEAFAGGASSGTLPSSYYYRLGGIRRPAADPYGGLSRISYPGFQPDEFVGRQAQLLGVRGDYYLTESVVIGLSLAAGGAFQEPGLTFSNHTYRLGGGISASYLSILGPIEFTLTAGEGSAVRGYVSIGYDF
jgi:NTE family protein